MNEIAIVEQLPVINEKIKEFGEQLTNNFSKRQVRVRKIENNKKSKSNIEDNYIKFDELNLQIGLDALTEKGTLVKKYKDAISSKLDEVERDIETINTMEHNNEILVEYLKHKNLSLAIKEVNDRHFVLEQVRERQEIAKERIIEEAKIVEKVEEVLSAPIEVPNGQMTIDDFEEKINEELLEAKFKVITTRENLKYLVSVMKERGMKYESITE